MNFISTFFVNQVSAGVSATTMTNVSAFHKTIRSLISSNYDTFLQGSYANDTALSNIDDVDIVAVKKPNLGLLPIGYIPVLATNPFLDIKQKLETNSNYRGKVYIGSKCLNLNLLTMKADIVPAVRFSGALNVYSEPIIIANNIRNYPKTHFARGSRKNIDTNNNYKKIVRMIKYFVYKWNIKNIAPSYYLECLIYSYPRSFFINNLPESLYGILSHMVSNNFYSRFPTISGDKQVISTSEWNYTDFSTFKGFVAGLLPFLRSAIMAQDRLIADTNFKTFYNI